ncbi:very short patch repair endonuclease [Blastococcus sp. TF02A-30]|uniref:very short patch repair endonuclease n=1 Tax=Blastococcus sp. TF02A-30 TaxID=2250580 RepID=UPI002100C35E|nr:very short patch repair endonuclease [Blastococcus sp. TF02A-30]
MARTPQPGPHPGSSSAEMSRRMGVVKKRDNGPEMAVRRLLHAAGLRYRVAWPVPGQRRRTIDIAFTRARLAVFIDGCFWHGCPLHATSPKANAAWWAEKIATNQARDADVTAQLRELAWTVLRFWEHEPPGDVVMRIVEALEGIAAGQGAVSSTCSSNAPMKSPE